MAVIKTHALDGLAKYIRERVPELAGKINAGPCEAPKIRTWPHLNIWPIKFRYYPDQASLHSSSRSKVVMNVGRHEGTVQLWLGATTDRRRRDLEDKVMDVFLSTPGRPGIVFFPVPCHDDAVVAWELVDGEWRNELALGKKWFSILAVTAQIPALVTRDGVYTIDDLRLTLTEDLTSEITEIPASQQETVRVLEDGSIELVP